MDNGTTPSVTIRQAELRDLPLLRELWLAMIEEQRKKPFYPFPNEDDDARLTADLATVLQHLYFAAFLAFDPAGAPLGFCAIEQQERRFGTPRYYVYFHGIYTYPKVRVYSSVPVAVRLCLAACHWAEARNLEVVECDNPAGYPPWWKGTLPFRATCSHYVSKVSDCQQSLSTFGPRATASPPPPQPVVLEDFPVSPDVEVEGET